MEDNSSDHHQYPSSPEEQLIAAVCARDYRAVLQALLCAPIVNINVSQDAEHQRSPLHTAAWNGDLLIVLILLDSRHGVDIEARDRNGNTPLQIAAYKGHTEVAKALMDQGADIETMDNVWERTPLQSACDQQKLEVAFMLMDKGASIDPDDREALYRACKDEPDHWKLVKVLANRKD